MKFLVVMGLFGATLALTGCTAMTNAGRELLGLPALTDPSVALKPAETRWLLVKNPRFGDVPSEPEYVWVEEDKVPTTITTLIRGEKAIIASPEVVARYGPPPGTGKISPRQGMALPTETQPSSSPPRAAATRSAPSSTQTNGRTPAAASPVKQGLVLYVDTTRVAVDLTAADGLRPGSLLSLRRDRVPIVHPVTGEVLGDLDEEVATARVTEVRDRFSVAELQSIAPGASVQVKDRVVAK
jgi:flagellar assembly FlgT-like protein